MYTIQYFVCIDAIRFQKWNGVDRSAGGSLVDQDQQNGSQSGLQMGKIIFFEPKIKKNQKK
jgi:hypothetical protein